MATTKRERRPGHTGESDDERALSEARFVAKMKRMATTHATITPDAGARDAQDDEPEDD